jgi:dolichyl-phosphate-mannose--protein O-mannosyl transferase
VAVANPLVWLLVLPATVYTAIRAARGRDEGLWYLTALFLLSYLPLALARRPIWVDTALSVLPYAIMAVAYFVATAFSRARMRRTVVILYITLVVITSVPLYVFVIGKGFEVPILKEYLMKHHVQRVMQLSDGDAPPPAGR